MVAMEKHECNQPQLIEFHWRSPNIKSEQFPENSHTNFATREMAQSNSSNSSLFVPIRSSSCLAAILSQ